jgi:hypothetical protein
MRFPVEIKTMTRNELAELDCYFVGTEEEWNMYYRLDDQEPLQVAVNDGRAFAVVFRSFGLSCKANLVSMTGPRVQLSEDLEALEVDEALEDL